MNRESTKYSPEMRVRAVRMVAEHRGEHSCRVRKLLHFYRRRAARPMNSADRSPQLAGCSEAESSCGS